jgi:hypothetical protein
MLALVGVSLRCRLLSSFLSGKQHAPSTPQRQDNRGHEAGIGVNGVTVMERSDWLRSTPTLLR